MKIRLCQPLSEEVLKRFETLPYDPETLEVSSWIAKISAILAKIEPDIDYIDVEFEISSFEIPRICDSIIGVKKEKYKIKNLGQELGEFKGEDRYEIFYPMFCALELETDSYENTTVIGRLYTAEKYKELTRQLDFGLKDEKLNLVYKDGGCLKVSEESIHERYGVYPEIPKYSKHVCPSDELEVVVNKKYKVVKMILQGEGEIGSIIFDKRI